MNEKTRRTSRFLWTIPALCAVMLGALVARSQDAVPGAAVAFDAPFLFSYGSWEKKVQVEGGRALLRGAGVSGKGGAGVNVNLNWGTRADEMSPALRLRVGAENKVKFLRLLLRDTKERVATYEFPLPAPGADFVLVTPREGVPLSKPQATEKGVPDFSALMQWQLTGDWSDAPLDVEVQSIALAAPDETMRAERVALSQKEEAVREQMRREQATLREKYGKRNAQSPVVEHTGWVAPDMVALTIQAGRVVPSKLSKYQPQPGDEKRAKDSATILLRGGQEIAWLIGPKKDHTVSFETLQGDPLLSDVAGDAANYSITSKDDAAFAGGVRPIAVHRKSKPTDWVQPSHEFAMRHIIYLQMPRALQTGKSYSINLGALNVQTPIVSLVNNPKRVRSEAVHVNQIGYRPDDPAKRAFLSIWLGTGGAHRFPDGLAFSLVEEKSGKAVFSGKVEMAKAVEQPERMFRDENFNKTDVLRMDFSAPRTPGTYRVVVAGVGCSYPFEIGANVWRRAFLTQMRGLYNNRSGVALAPPFADWTKPRDFHPADGTPVFQSTYSIMDGPGESPELARRSTGQSVPEAWGGYHDAGDWNPRRVTHMRVTMAQPELLELFPAYYGALKLPIPPTKGVPDVLTEALFELDCFRRLQMPDGGVRFGIETGGDPIEGEVSWLQSMPAYVYAPDIWSSYVYAGVAARAAKVLAPHRPDLAKTYRDSALKAMAWAEADWDKRRAAGTLATLRWEARDDRNLSALILFDLTGDKHWHDVFLENSALKVAGTPIFAWGDHVQRDAAFLYARLPGKLADAAIQKNALAAVEQQAQASLNYAGNNAFNLTTPDKGKPMFLGFYSTPDAIELARAHFLTGKAEYLAGVVQANQFLSGANPANMTYTTGLGSNPVQHPLHLDSRRSGQKTPPGFTVYGNYDFVGWNEQWATWPLDFYLDKSCIPPARQWPVPEAYWDIFLYPAINEWTMDIWTPNVWVWGYLAARK